MKLWMAISVTVVILAVAILGLTTRWSGGETLTAKEMMVIRDVLTVGDAETRHLSRFGKYAATLAELGPPINGAAGQHAVDLIPASLASGDKDGYLFMLTLTPAGYTVNARPKVLDSTGRRCFYLDQNGTIHQNWGPHPATANSPELK